MFTGIIVESGRLVSADAVPGGAGRRFVIKAASDRLKSQRLGDSIAVNGTCLTLVARDSGGKEFAFDVSEETLARTNLGSLAAGARLHLEPSLRVGDELGGHFVTGHVDGVGRVRRCEPQGDYVLFEVEIDGEARVKVGPYLVEKGSWAVDGVSLTVNSVEDGPSWTRVGMTLIPHTLALTRFGSLGLGDPVNVEADILAKYAARALRFKA